MILGIYQVKPPKMKGYKPFTFKDGKHIEVERFYRTPPIVRQICYLRNYYFTRHHYKWNYFHVIYSLDPVQRKECDMVFIRHFKRVHEFFGNSSTKLEYWRYRWIYHLYRKELNYSFGMFEKYADDKFEVSTESLPKKFAKYYERWDILSDVHPQFVEAIHGVGPEGYQTAN